jgi:hypothetical protein
MRPFLFNYGAAITKSDATNITMPAGKRLTEGIYIGGAGNLVVVFEDDSTATITGALAGTILPLAVKRVNSTNTTATAMVALFQI